MTYDLAVWEGEAPPSDEAALATFERLMAVLEGGQTDPPSDRIQAYVAALLDQWPDITDDRGADSPWADGPLIGNAFGTAIYFSMVWSRCEEASAFAAAVAAAHGLVCFDPQSSILRSAQGPPPASADHGVRRILRRRSG